MKEEEQQFIIQSETFVIEGSKKQKKMFKLNKQI